MNDYLEDLIIKYNEIASSNKEEQTTLYSIFENKLLASNEEDILQFHYHIIGKEKISDLYYDLRASFMDRPLESAENFLLKKFSGETNIRMKADIIQILGTLKSDKILPVAEANITSKDRDIRYRCIIVIGWVGNKNDLEILNERLKNEPDDELRGYAATAMRQLWYKNKVDQTDVLPYLYTAIINEKSEKTLSFIIIVIQNLLKRKFGIQERLYDGTVSGNAFKAKEKIIKQLKLQ
jgi:hypothetical protein